MACRLITVVVMTDLNNSNESNERPTDADSTSSSASNASSHSAGQHADGSAPSSGSTPSTPDMSDEWAAFAAAHADDLQDVESSRNAKRFEKHAQRKDKEALLSIQDLSSDSFVGTATPRGPRDFSGSSWLDTDDVMDRYGDDFVPPNPSIGKIRTPLLVFWILFIVGVVGLIASVLLPSMASILGTVFGLCALIGGAGLLSQLKGHNPHRNGYTDDGARV